jgi:DDE superfamily endonuclease
LGDSGPACCQKSLFHSGQTVFCFFIYSRSVTDTSDSRYSILPAISLDGILTVKIVEGSFNTSRFAEFIEELLERMNPFPEVNSVIVMDNCRIHKSNLIAEMIEERYVIDPASLQVLIGL